MDTASVRDIELDHRVRAVLVALGVGLAGIVAALLVVRFVGLTFALFNYHPSPLVLIGLSLVLVQGISFGGVATLYLLYVGRSPLELFDFPSFRDLGIAGIGFFGAFAILLTAGYAAQQFNAPTAENNVARIAVKHPEVLLLLIPAAFIFIGPGEELLFRGIVQGRLRRAFSPWIAIPAASVIFGAVHYLALSGPPIAKLVTIGILSVITLVFGVTYEYTDNLVVPALIHGAYDAVLFSLLYIVVVYGPGVESGTATATLGLVG